MRPYFTSASSAALVAGPAARVVQDSDARPPVLVRSCPGIPCRWFSACQRRSSKATAFCWHEDVDCPPNLQLPREQDLCSCRHKSLEQFAVRLTKIPTCHTPGSGGCWGHFIWTVRPRRIVNSVLKYSYLLLTYLLTYLLNYSGRTLRITMKYIQT